MKILNIIESNALKAKNFWDNHYKNGVLNPVTDEFKEEQHPRDEEGKFASKPGSGTKSAVTSKEHEENIKELESVVTAKEPKRVSDEEIDKMSSQLKRNMWGYHSETRLNDLPQELIEETKDTLVSDLADRLKANTEFVKYSNGDIYDGVNELIHGWAETSADNSPDAIAMQNAAKELFGLNEANTEHFPEQLMSEKGGEAEKAFLKAQYDETQKFFKSHKITHVRVFRGYVVPIPTDLEEKEEEYSDRLDSLTITIERSEEGLKEGIVPNTAKIQEYLANLRVEKAEAEEALKKAQAEIAKYDKEGEISLQPISSFSLSYDVAKGFSGTGRYSRVIHAVIPVEHILSTCKTGFGCLAEGEVTVLAHKVDGGIMAPEIKNGYRQWPDEEEFIRKTGRKAKTADSAALVLTELENPSQDDKWITTKPKEGKGKHILLNNDGTIKGGAVPKSLQGKSLKEAFTKLKSQSKNIVSSRFTGLQTNKEGNKQVTSIREIQIPSFRNKEDAERFLKNKYGIRVTFGKTRISYIQSIVQTLSNLVETNSFIANSLPSIQADNFFNADISSNSVRSLSSLEKFTTMALYVQEKYSRDIFINQAFFGSSRAKTQLLSSEKKGFHPKGVTDVASIVTHEIGHSLAFSIFAAYSDFPKEFKADFRELFRKEREEKPISQYAKESEHERFAESFVAWVHAPKETWNGYVKDIDMFFSKYNERVE